MKPVSVFAIILIASTLLSAQQQPVSTEQGTGKTAQQEAPRPHIGDRLDIRQLIERAHDNYKNNLAVVRNYVYQERSVNQELNKDDSVKKTEIRTHEVLMVYGQRYRKLIAVDDKPLDSEQARNEDEKFQKFYNEQKKKADHGDRSDEQKREKDARQFADALVKMMNFTLVGEDEVDGRPVYVVDAEPNREQRASSRAEKIVQKMRGKLWVDRDDYQWVRAEADLLDDFGVGLFLFKLHKGAHLEFEQTRINNEIWLPKRVAVQASGRMLMKTDRMRQETTYSKYQRFKSDAKIVGIAPSAPSPAEQTSPPPR